MDIPVQPLLNCATTGVSLSDIPRWYAAYTLPRHEKTVTDQLLFKSVEVFLPTFTTESRWKDRRKQIQTPLFPGYVFTRVRRCEKSKILSVPSVVRMLSFNGMLAAIDDSEIEAVRKCVEQGVGLGPYPFLEVGERVRVRSGAFEGLEGLVIRRKNKCRLVISIALIHQSVAIEIDQCLLEPIKRSAAKITSERSTARYSLACNASPGRVGSR